MAHRDSHLEPDGEMALSDLVGRVLDRGTVITGDVVISVAGVDLIQLGLSLFLASAETARRHGLRPAPFHVMPAPDASLDRRIADPSPGPPEEGG